MEKQLENGREGRLPGEIVEIYRQPDPCEVVETYVRPLPSSHPHAVWQGYAGGKKKRSRTGLWIFLGCLGALLLMAGLAAVLHGLRSADDPFESYCPEGLWEEAASREITISTWPTGLGVELPVRWDFDEQLTPQNIYRRVNPSVVTVMVQLGDHMSVGSGVIFTENGYILTNYHVVEGGEQCIIMLDTGYQYEASFVAGDQNYDLAILKVDTVGLPAAEFGDSDRLVVGDPVYAIGNPLGYDLLGTMTDGIVSAVDREVDVDGQLMTLIQTNAALNSGNSGGPLINQYGQVVGINVIKLDSSHSTVEGLGFAIPSSVMERVVNDLLTYGERLPEPLLGISVSLVSTQLTDTIFGLEVVTVSPESAGERAGIQVGDYVVSADGKSLSASRDLLRVRRQHYVGEELEMVLWRNGELIEVTLQLLESAES